MFNLHLDFHEASDFAVWTQFLSKMYRASHQTLRQVQQLFSRSSKKHEAKREHFAAKDGCTSCEMSDEKSINYQFI